MKKKSSRKVSAANRRSLEPVVRPRASALELALAACRSIRFAVTQADRYSGEYSLNDILAADKLAREAVAAAANEARRTDEILQRMDRQDLEIIRLEDAIRWALGEKGDFPSRPEGAGSYYWRAELRKRAGMSRANVPSEPRHE